MKREIKFRFWDKSENEMIYDNTWIAEYIESHNEDGNIEAMQHTGVQDKSKAEIVEGDIVSYREYYNGDFKESAGNGVIKYEDGCFIVAYNDCGFELDTATVFNRDLIVIGNIYENPELLVSKI